MRDIFRQACADTLVSLGITRFSWWKGGRSAAVAFVFIVLVFGVRGHEAAMVEAWDIFWLAIALGCAFLATFLANLWLAPYRIMNERLNVIANTQKNAEPVDEEAEQRGRLHVKREVLRREMEDLRRCIRARAERGEMQHVNDTDYDFITLKQRHAALIPSRFDERKMEIWIGQIIALSSTIITPRRWNELSGL